MPDRYRRIPPGAIKIDLPNVAQLEDYTCGPSALLAVCAYFGVGPEHEADLEAAMGIDDTGSDPHHLTRVARRYGLRCTEYQPMSTDELRACVDRRRPVVMLLQAWADRRRRTYRDHWTDGHWVVAIGHDRAGVYFEDPSLHAARGFLAYDELDDRWHDVGARGEHVHRYGVALWRPGVRASAYARRARRID